MEEGYLTAVAALAVGGRHSRLWIGITCHSTPAEHSQGISDF